MSESDQDYRTGLSGADNTASVYVAGRIKRLEERITVLESELADTERERDDLRTAIRRFCERYATETYLKSALDRLRGIAEGKSADEQN